MNPPDILEDIDDLWQIAAIVDGPPLNRHEVAAVLILAGKHIREVREALAAPDIEEITRRHCFYVTDHPFDFQHGGGMCEWADGRCYQARRCLGVSGSPEMKAKVQAMLAAVAIR